MNFLYKPVLNKLKSGLQSFMTCHLAFTLAEVLLVIGIIGVVAVLTIPTLMKKTNDLEYRTAWKKAYATISQATLRIQNDNNGTLENIYTDAGDSGSNSRIVLAKYAEYLAFSNTCGYNNVLGNCWTADNMTNLKGEDVGQGDQEGGAVLKDGTTLNFHGFSAACNNNWGNNQTFNWCGVIAVDVNGFKKPNKVGKDIFNLYVVKDGLKPFGASGDQTEDDVVQTCPDDGVTFGTYNYPGYGCAAKYLYSN